MPESAVDFLQPSGEIGIPAKAIKCQLKCLSSRLQWVPCRGSIEGKSALCRMHAQAGIEKLEVLRVFYASNNRIRDWVEIDVLAKCSSLQELVMMGNPLVPAPGTPEYRTEVCSPSCWHAHGRLAPPRQPYIWETTPVAGSCIGCS